MFFLNYAAQDAEYAFRTPIVAGMAALVTRFATVTALLARIQGTSE
jgi:hypothetical protein